MPGEAINIGSIYADLDVNSGKMEAGIARGERALRLIEAELKNLDAQLKQGTIGLQEHAQRVAELGTVATDLANRMKAANSALAGTASAIDLINSKSATMAGATDAAGRSARGMTQGLMQVGYALDDVQYGMQGVLNQIQPMVQGFGQAFGLAGPQVAAVAAGAQILTVALYQVYRHMDQIRELAGQGIEVPKSEGIEGLKSQLDELEAKIEKVQKKGKVFTLAEKVEYDKDVKKAKELRAEVQEDKDVSKLTEAQSKEEKAAEAGFAEAVAESGGPAALAELADAFRKQVVDPAAAEAGLVARGVPRDEARKRAQAGQVIDAETNDFVSPESLARREFQRAGAGDKGARGRVVNALDEGSSTGDSDFARRIEKLSPETKEKIKSQDDRAKDEEQARRQREQDDERKRKLEAQLDREGSKANDQAAAVIFPRLKHEADRAALKVATGKATRDEAVGGLQEGLVGKGMSEDDAKDAARRAFSATQTDEDPLKRSARLKREALSKAEEAVPDLTDTVESAVARGVLSGKGAGKFAADLDSQLRKAGMGAEESQETAKALLERGQESVRQRLANLAPGRDQEQEHARSEVYATSQLTQKVQAGVGTDSEPKKTNTLLEKVNTTLEKIASKRTVEIEVG